MSLSQQILRLTMRELQRMTPWLVLYSAVLAVAVARSAQWIAPLSAGSMPTGVLITLSIAALCGLIVLPDNPVRDDAFWTTQPIDGRAIATAKLIILVLILTLAGTAAIIALHAWGYSVAESSRISAGVVGTLSLLAIGTASVASSGLTTTAAAFVAGGSLIAVVALKSLGWVTFPMNSGLWTAVVAALDVSGVIWLQRQYRVRPRDRRSVIASMLLGLATIGLQGRVPRVPSASSHGPSDASSEVVLQLPLAGQPTCDGRRIIVPFEISSASWARVDITRPQATITTESGGSVHVVNDSWMQSAGLWGPIFSPTMVDALVDNDATTGGRRTRRSDIVFRLPEGAGRMVCGHVARIDMRVQMRSAAGIEVMRMPMHREGQAAINGLRASLALERSPSTGESVSAFATLDLAMLNVADAPRFDQYDIELAIRDTVTGEIARLNGHSEEDWHRSSDLPGLVRAWGTIEIEPWERQLGSKLATWRDRAELIVSTPVWSPRTTRDVSVSIKPLLSGRDTRDSMNHKMTLAVTTVQSHNSHRSY